jgi:hypothetical protein
VIRLYQLFAALALLTAAAQCFAVDRVIYVHMVNARKSKTVPRGNTLEMVWGSRKSQLHVLKAKTGQDGTAAFHLDEPLPSAVQLRPGGGYWDSCSPNYYNTREVLETGISAEEGRWASMPPKISDQFHPKPGEVYFFVCHIPFGEWLKTWFESLK